MQTIGAYGIFDVITHLAENSVDRLLVTGAVLEHG